jgi:hypothetical protein
MSDAAATPAWPSAVAARARREIDLKLVIAVLIGLVSVTGAVTAWRSAILSEQATDKDRQAVAETVRQEQDAANNEITVQDVRGRVASHAAALAAAQELEAQADRLSAAGDAGAARAASDEAVEQRVLARSYLEGGTAPVLLDQYVVTDPDTGRLALDEGSLQADLRALSQSQSQVNPSQTVREANRLREDSQRFDGWLVPLVSAIVLLTVAQILRQRAARLALTGLATCVWIVSSVIAFGGS